jgi:hypothetical protein
MKEGRRDEVWRVSREDADEKKRRGEKKTRRGRRRRWMPRGQSELLLLEQVLGMTRTLDIVDVGEEGTNRKELTEAVRMTAGGTSNSTPEIYASVRIPVKDDDLETLLEKSDIREQ